ncbi:divergent polysaccharide deacetylase family protein [Salinarimonas soli]|uniref:Divergent polysaccharide deacetylase family protein n=1 Tax=Salinarimonas soli TaxID=1638099 RepID=A0A5B2V7G3_9HYPH|nr:divergent polysaccharide deacetylase family protein [Salinarimonas soli]
MQPLGMDRREPRRLPSLPLARILAALAGAGAAALGAYVAVVDDPLGGEPYARVAVERIAAAPAPAAPAQGGRVVDLPGRDGARSTAVELESASGVTVLRPDGSGAPASVVVRVPTPPAAIRLAPAPDRRLVERGRHGTLPKAGEGVRPLDVYARPAESLPGGVTPAGRVAILVGGLGISQSATASAIAKLPPAMTLAFAPYGNDLERHVARAREDGHEVMLQVPMEPFDYPDNDPGPHTLTAKAKAAENLDRLHWIMARFSGYVGIVNFMGARITADEAAMAPILREIGTRGLGFLDDGSSPRSIVAALARKAGTPAAAADRVIDAVARPDEIDRELARLEDIARKGGVAVGSASALPLTIERLERWARGLEARGILLVPVSSVLRAER